MIYQLATQDDEVMAGAAGKGIVDEDSRLQNATTTLTGLGERVATFYSAVAKQMAVKLIMDPERYDRRQVCILDHRAPEAITEAEVAVFVDALRVLME